ncbi:MAG TPA: lactonase family protein [Burkholderiaceae bacterium]|nr:lactonase family protein [Burkholderiaceae bacterium]
MSTSIAARAATIVYVANADSQEISVLSLDRATGALAAIETVPVGGTVMPLAPSPDKRVLYAALRSQPYRVVSFAIDAASGRLRKLGEAALADSMANIDVDRSGRWLFAASYGGHKITVNAIDDKGVVGAVQQLIPTAPNAHAIHADAANRFVFATSLGGDQLAAWRFDVATGRLTANEPAVTATAPKSGPRHFVWDAAQRHLYLLCELDASLYVYDVDAARGALREVQRTSALPPGFAGKPWAADLHLAPNGRHLYASERSSSTLTVFEVDAVSGQLKTIGQTPTEKTPRGFAIDPSGRWLIAAGQDANALGVHAIDPASGGLGPAQHFSVGRNPNWVEIVDLP